MASSRPPVGKEVTSRLPTVRVCGPLADHAAELRADLLRQGYTILSCRNLLGAASHLSRWPEEQSLGLRELSEEQVDGFLCARRAKGCSRFLSRKSLAAVRRFLAEASAYRPSPACTSRARSMARSTSSSLTILPGSTRRCTDRSSRNGAACTSSTARHPRQIRSSCAAVAASARSSSPWVAASRWAERVGDDGPGRGGGRAATVGPGGRRWVRARTGRGGCLRVPRTRLGGAQARSAACGLGLNPVSAAAAVVIRRLAAALTRDTRAIRRCGGRPAAALLGAASGRSCPRGCRDLPDARLSRRHRGPHAQSVAHSARSTSAS